MLNKNIEVLHDLKWFNVVKVIAEEAEMIGLWKDKLNVAVLPFTSTSHEENKLTIEKIGSMYEMNPLRNNNYTYTAITGDVENEDVLSAAKRELFEETGYLIEDTERWIYLGEITTSKQTNEIHPCFAVNANYIEQAEATGDGTINEKLSKFEWIDPEKIFELEDAFLNILFLKLLNKLGAFE